MPRNSRNERPSGDRRRPSSAKSDSPFNKRSSRPSPGGFRKKADGEDKPRFGDKRPSSGSRAGGGPFRKGGPRFEDRGEKRDRPFKKDGDSRDGDAGRERPFGKPRFGDKRPSSGSRAGGGSFRKGGPRFEDRGEKRDRPFKKDFDSRDGEAGKERPFGKPRFQSRDERKPGPFRKDDSKRSSSRFSKGDAEERPKRSFDRPDSDAPRGERPYSKPSSRPQGESRFGKKPPFRKTEGAEGEPRKEYSGKFERKSFATSRLKKKRLPGKSKQEQKPTGDSDLIRLNKFISNSGVCSRREADDLIKMGLVTVNGQTVTEMGHKVKPTDDVRYEGKRLKAEKPVYILLNKPKGFITTTDDPQERNTVMHIIANACKQRVYPVGRLDRNTTGLLLLTNDGDLADKLTHPSYNVKKIYKVELDKPLTKADFQKISEGIHLEEGKAVPDDLAIVGDDSKTVGIELHIGWNRIVRRIFEALQYEVVKLDRVVYAGLDKKALGRGEWRFLSPEEVVRLKHLQ